MSGYAQKGSRNFVGYFWGVISEQKVQNSSSCSLQWPCNWSNTASLVHFGQSLENCHYSVKFAGDSCLQRYWGKELFQELFSCEQAGSWLRSVSNLCASSPALGAAGWYPPAALPVLSWECQKLTCVILVFIQHLPEKSNCMGLLTY